MKLVCAVSVLALIVSVSLGAPPERELADREIPLKNWMPALWEPSRGDTTRSEGRISAMALPSEASHFIALNPCRLADTRDADGPHGGPIMSGGASRVFNIPASSCAGIPAAVAYSLNIAVTGSAPGSIQFLTAYPAGTPRPLVATMNFDGGETTSNSALVPGDATGSIEIFVTTDSHVILDINGYIKQGVVTSVSAGTGMTGGGTGDVTVGIANGGVGATQLGAGAVSTGAIADGAVTGAKIENNQVVRSINTLRDTVTLAGAGSASVSTTGSTITVTASGVPPGGVISGPPNDTTIIGAGFTEIGASNVEIWRTTSLTAAPSGRTSHSAIWTGTRMVIWGGLAVANLDTGGRYDPAADSWTPTTTTGAPSARSHHTAVWTGSRMIVWGGADRTNTGGLYDPVNDNWTLTTTTGAPAGRFSHAAVWSGTWMIIWGGFSATDRENTGGRYEPIGNSWTATSTAGAPSARIEALSVWTGSKMVVWGGASVSAFETTGGQYDPNDDSWTATNLADAPSGRVNARAAWTGTLMMVWGGDTAIGQTNTGGRYDPGSDSWTSMSTNGAPSPRSNFTAIWTGTRFVVWGGTSPAFESTGGQYDPTLDFWTPTTPVGAPAGRSVHTAVWTGRAMIIWGGQVPGSPFPAPVNSGGQWTTMSLYQKN